MADEGAPALSAVGVGPIEAVAPQIMPPFGSRCGMAATRRPCPRCGWKRGCGSRRGPPILSIGVGWSVARRISRSFVSAVCRNRRVHTNTPTPPRADVRVLAPRRSLPGRGAHGWDAVPSARPARRSVDDAEGPSVRPSVRLSVRPSVHRPVRRSLASIRGRGVGVTTT